MQDSTKIFTGDSLTRFHSFMQELLLHLSSAIHIVIPAGPLLINFMCTYTNIAKIYGTSASSFEIK